MEFLNKPLYPSSWVVYCVTSSVGAADKFENERLGERKFKAWNVVPPLEKWLE
jgi:hypothetical protein